MDSEFFAAFYCDMVPQLVRFVGRRLPTDSAEDVAHDTMITLWRKDPPSPGDDQDLGRLRALAFLIAAGHVRNAERKAASERRLLEAIASETALPPASTDPTAEAVLSDRLQALLSQERPDDRRALGLLSLGFKTAEIADVLEVSPKAASMRLRRAIDRLRRARTESRCREGGCRGLPACLPRGIPAGEGSDEGCDRHRRRPDP
ncbi:RNA polymerase sigma factor [Pimelobacter simplex]|uniref:RNA polymerase sigma factor n=1 Tax=Nocardioides simplex TaxID=2045 RepID=UPI0035B2161E